MNKHNARRRFGQNFLTDPSVIRAIINLIQPKKGENLIEIGPGLGALTTPLLENLDHLTVIEIDRDLVSRLQGKWTPSRLAIVSNDVLNVDFSKFGGKLRILGNLPYNISTPLLFHLLNYTTYIHDLHFMLQKEVVERMVAKPGSSAYGRLSVMLQYRFDMEMMMTVPAHAFNPKPKVESAIVYMVPKYTQPSAVDEPHLSRLVKTAFSQRRKTLRNTLKGMVDQSIFPIAQIDDTLRAEDLSIADYVRLANLTYPGSV